MSRPLNQNQLTMAQNSNPLAGLHKSKMYSLIIAGIALITLLLPWISVKVFGYSQSWNGLRGWGLLSLLGVGGAIAVSLMGDKAQDYDATMKKAILGCLGAIALGALLFFIRKSSVAGGYSGVNTGIGLWLCLVVGALGVLLQMGIIKPPKSIDEKVDKLS